MFNIMNKLTPNKTPAPKRKAVVFTPPKKVNTVSAVKDITKGSNRTKVKIKKTKFQK